MARSTPGSNTPIASDPQARPSSKRSHPDALIDLTATPLAGSSSAKAVPSTKDDQHKEKRRKHKHKSPIHGAANVVGDGPGDRAPLSARPPSSPSTTNVAQVGGSLSTGANVDAPTEANDATMAETGSAPLDTVSSEERRRRKGKGRADDAHESAAHHSLSDDDAKRKLERLQKELAFKEELIASQVATLASLQSAVSCTVCLETLDRPYSLQCGHVFCRKCLVQWFFRPDPEAEEREAAGARSDHTASSASGSDDHSDEDANSSSASSGGSSFVGGQINGVAFRVQGVSARAPLEDTIGRLVDAEVERQQARGRSGHASAESLAAVRAARLARFVGGAGGGEGARPSEGDAGDGRGPISAESDGARIQELPESSTDNAAASLGQVGSAAPSAPASAAPRAASVRQASPSPTYRQHGPPVTPVPPAGAPAPTAAVPAQFRRVPHGPHRLKNLVCPSCRASCSSRAPNRVFVLDDVLSALRRGGVGDGAEQRKSPSKQHVPRGGAEGHASELDPPVAMDEGDASWGGLFPGGEAGGGAESTRDRRRRLAQVVRDREDGVRRCGECNWELDERTGRCEGCGREWGTPSGSSESEESSSADGRGGFFSFGCRNLGRQHHDLEVSVSGTDSEEEDDEGVGSQDTYDIDDGFLVKTDEEEEEHERTRARHRRRRASRDTRRSGHATASTSGSESQSGSQSQSQSQSESGSEASASSSSAASGIVRPHAHRRDRARATVVISSSGSSSGASSEEDEAAQRRARRRARAKRRQGEIIDEEPDTESSGSGSTGGSQTESESGSRTGSEEEDASEDSRTARRRRRQDARVSDEDAASEEGSEDRTSSSSEESEASVSIRSSPRRKKRVIPESESE